MENLAASALTDYLTVVSFLIGSSSFVLGLYVTKMSGVTTNGIIKYYKMIIYALVLPSIAMIIWALIVTAAFSLYVTYLPIFVLLLIPSIIILHITRKQSLV